MRPHADGILRRAGWTVQRFHGTTIHRKAANGAYVVKREVEGRRRQLALRARHEALRRRAHRDALPQLLRPFPRLLRRRDPERTARAGAPPPKSEGRAVGVLGLDAATPRPKRPTPLPRVRTHPDPARAGSRRPRFSLRDP